MQTVSKCFKINIFKKKLHVDRYVFIFLRSTFRRRCIFECESWFSCSAHSERSTNLPAANMRRTVNSRTMTEVVITGDAATLTVLVAISVVIVLVKLTRH